jgi:hypothetical protein
MHTIVNLWLDCAYVVKNLPQYRNTFLGSAKIILFSFFAKNFTQKTLNVENLENSIKATKFEPMTSSMTYGNLSSI